MIDVNLGVPYGTATALPISAAGFGHFVTISTAECKSCRPWRSMPARRTRCHHETLRQKLARDEHFADSSTELAALMQTRSNPD
jgi:hypothetical protein